MPPAKTRAGPAAHLVRGNHAESIALAHLQQHGLTLVQRNFRCPGGEIDLVMWQRQELVFVEVRYRRSEQYGGALDSVTQQKQRKLRVAAESFLAHNDALVFSACRFDVVAVRGAPSAYAVNWVVDAF